MLTIRERARRYADMKMRPVSKQPKSLDPGFSRMLVGGKRRERKTWRRMCREEGYVAGWRAANRYFRRVQKCD